MTAFKKIISQTIKNRDMFGHRVAWNYNQKGDVPNTLPGGFISALLTFVITVYGVLQLKAMILNENDSDNSYLSKTDYKNIGRVSLDDGEHIPMYWFKHRDSRAVDLDEINKYLDIHYTQVNKTFVDGKTKEIHEHFPAVDCSPEMEEEDPEVIALFSSSKQVIYCPLLHHEHLALGGK